MVNNIMSPEIKLNIFMERTHSITIKLPYIHSMDSNYHFNNNARYLNPG